MRRRITFLEKGALGTGQRKIAQLRLAAPILAFVGDRFVIRDPSEQHTIGGGMVLDPDGEKEKFRSVTLRQSLTSALTHDIDFWVRATIAQRGFALRENLLSKSQFSETEISEALSRLQQHSEIIFGQDIAADHEFWQKLRAQAIALIDEAHKQSPERAGVDLNELRSALRIHESHVIELLLADLCAKNFVRNGSIIARGSHRPMLPPRLQTVAQRVRQALSKEPVRSTATTRDRTGSRRAACSPVSNRKRRSD